MMYGPEVQEIETLVMEYSDMVYRIAFSNMKSASDAEDVVQEVFLRCIRNKPEFQSEEHKKAWLIRTTLNVCRTILKSAWFRHTQPLPEDYGEAFVSLDYVHKEVMLLPVKYRNVIHLYYYEGYSVKELSALLKKKESTVKSLLKRGRDRLRERLQGDCNEF